LQVVKALATAQLEAQRIADEAQEHDKATGAQDFDLQVENMSKVGSSAVQEDLEHTFAHPCIKF